MIWPVAAMFDLVASDYGWTDDVMLDTTLSRLRMAVTLILRRKQEEGVFRLRVAEIHAKAVVSALAGLAQSKKGGKAIAKFAQNLEFVDDPGKKDRELPSTSQIEGLFGDGRRNR